MPNKLDPTGPSGPQEPLKRHRAPAVAGKHSTTSLQITSMSASGSIGRGSQGLMSTAQSSISSPTTIDHFHSLVSGGVPYGNNGTTRHDIRTVPTYVMDRLAKVKVDDGVVEAQPGSGEKVNPIQQGTHDPFIRSFQNNTDQTKWEDFLGTVKGRDANVAPIPEEQEDANDILQSYKLDDKWQGESRLLSYFRNTSLRDSFDEEAEGLKTEDNDLESGTHKKHHNKDYYKEKARYWLQENKKNWKPRLMDSLVSNSYVPLAFRMVTFLLSVITLGLAANLVRMQSQHDGPQSPSSIMAVVVQAIAIAYTLYTTYDEFYSQPLGLRDPNTKLRLILLDLLFIIMCSANLGLGYQELFDSQGICLDADLSTETPNLRHHVCLRQRALTSFLFLVLLSWCITFSISIFRVVHVVSDRDRT